jgi:hypothetical protein
MLNKEMFPELHVDGNLFGSTRYFDSKRRGTVFSRCDSTSGGRVDCKKMIDQLKDCISHQMNEIKRDFESAGDAVFLISRSDRSEMLAFLDALERASRKLGGYSSADSNLVQKLNASVPPQMGGGSSGNRPRARNSSKELCSREYISQVTADIFGSERFSSSSFSDAISKDAGSIIDSIYSDLRDALHSIYRVDERNKKCMIDAVKVLGGIASSSNASDVVRILDYKGKIEIPLPRNPIEWESEELLKGHQSIEDFLKNCREVLFEQNRVEIDCVEMYNSDISSMVRALLVLDNRQNRLYIELYIGSNEVYRGEHRDLNDWREIFRPSPMSRLLESRLTCRLLTEEEVDRMNGVAKSGLNSLIDGAGVLGDAASHMQDLGNAGNLLSLPGLIRDTFFRNSNSIKAEYGDFIFYYGNKDKVYGGHFDAKTLKVR